MRHFGTGDSGQWPVVRGLRSALGSIGRSCLVPAPPYHRVIAQALGRKTLIQNRLVGSGPWSVVSSQ